MDISEVIRSYIGSKYNLVGVKIISKDEKRKEKLINKPKKPLRYCQFVRECAVNGSEFILALEDISCPNAQLALGFVEPQYVDVQPRIMPANTKFIEILPLEKVSNPDVVLVIADAKQVMDISIILGNITAEFKGELAVCGEATAKVFMSKHPNISFLCNGSRMFAKFKSNEVVLGMPYEVINELAEKIASRRKTCSALCGCQVSDIPPQIIQNFKKIGFEKATDYFFGKIGGRNVKIYLNKDINGRYKSISFYILLKDKEGEKIVIERPFEVIKRGIFSEIFGIFEIEGIGINLYNYENLKQVLEDIVGRIQEMMK